MKRLKFLEFWKVCFLGIITIILGGLWIFAANHTQNAVFASTKPLEARQPQIYQAQQNLDNSSNLTNNWYPSKYGAGDEIGAANLLAPSLVKKAIGLVTEGKVYSLGLELNENSPGYPPRKLENWVLQTIGTNQSNNDDVIFASLNVGTQIDGLAHLGINGIFYNGNKAQDFVKMDGLTKLGVEKIPPIVTRGVMLDIARYRGVERLTGGEVITVADIEKAAKQQGVTIRAGDVVLFHTGWLSLLDKDRETFTRVEPGPGIEAAEYLARKGVVAVGADNSRLEADPHEAPNLFFPVHQTLLAKNGIYILENINTSVLVNANLHEFLFMLGQPRITGATQTFINPVAIR